MKGKSSKMNNFIYDIGDLVSEKQAVSVRGFVKKLSPIMKSPKVSYFRGELTDGDHIISFVCFKVEKREILRLFQEADKTVIILNCDVKPDTSTGEFKIQFRNGSSVIAANNQLPISYEKLEFSTISTVLLKTEFADDLHIKGRCTSKQPPKTVKIKDKVHKVFTALIFDGSGEIEFQLWYQDKIPLEKPFEATFLRLKAWKDKRYLTVTQFSQIKIL